MSMGRSSICSIYGAFHRMDWIGYGVDEATLLDGHDCIYFDMFGYFVIDLNCNIPRFVWRELTMASRDLIVSYRIISYRIASESESEEDKLIGMSSSTSIIHSPGLSFPPVPRIVYTVSCATVPRCHTIHVFPSISHLAFLSRATVRRDHHPTDWKVYQRGSIRSNNLESFVQAIQYKIDRSYNPTVVE